MKTFTILREGLLMGIGMCLPLLGAVSILGQLSSIDPFDYHTTRIINKIIENYECIELKNKMEHVEALPAP